MLQLKSSVCCVLSTDAKLVIIPKTAISISRKRYLCNMEKVQFTGNNFEEVKGLCGDKVLAPDFCMGFTMLSVDTGDGFVSVYEGDIIIREDDGSLRIDHAGQ